MKRNVTVWKDENGQWVISFDDDLNTRAVWTTGGGVDFERLITSWVDHGVEEHVLKL